ncbi:MAG: NAD(P)-dependent alcohol dehydrogenase [Janthinobacterium lividum]
MKAAVLEHYGSPQQFKIKDVDAPKLKSGQILIRNYASSVNPIDALVRQGTLRFASGLWGNAVIGCDFGGVVVESQSSRFQVGDEVFGFVSPMTGHAYAEQVAVQENVAALKPANLSYIEAAALPMVSLTAYQGLTAKGRLRAGQRVLINGCTGGVGAAAVQIAKALGAHVTGTCQGGRRAVARELGCDEVLDYHTQSIPQNHSFDLIFDTAAKLTLSQVEKSLTSTGLLVTTKPAYSNLTSAFSSAIDLLKPRMKMVQAKSKSEDLVKIKALVEQGQLKPIIAQAFPLEEIAKAHELLARGGFVGKVAVEIG